LPQDPDESLEDFNNLMLTPESYKSLLEEIASRHFPEETLALELEGESMVKSLFAETWEGHQDGHGDKYGFADLSAVKPILEIVTVAVSTFKVICEIRLLKKPDPIDTDQMQKQWAKRLRMEGIKDAKAKAIAADFARQLVALAKHS